MRNPRGTVGGPGRWRRRRVSGPFDLVLKRVVRGVTERIALRHPDRERGSLADRALLQPGDRGDEPGRLGKVLEHEMRSLAGAAAADAGRVQLPEGDPLV